MSVIVVTGAAGFLGRRVVEALTSRGEPVRVIVRRASQAKVVEPYGVDVAVADVRDEAALRTAFDGAERLIHLAAILRERGDATYHSVNVEGTARVYRAAAHASLSRSVHVSVVGADESSPEPYLASRWQAERTALGSGIPTDVVRFSALFGEGDEFLNVLAALVRTAPVVPVAGDGKARFQPIHVRDAAETAVRALLRDASESEIIEVGGPDILTYDQIIDTVAAAMHRRIVRVHVPLGLLAPIVKAMSLVMRTPPVTSNQIRMLRLENVPSAARSGAGSWLQFTLRPMRGNIDYVRNVGRREAIQIMLGRMPGHIRDH